MCSMLFEMIINSELSLEMWRALGLLGGLPEGHALELDLASEVKGWGCLRLGL